MDVRRGRIDLSRCTTKEVSVTKWKTGLVLLVLLWSGVLVQAQERTASACDTAEAKAFDFLVGDWRAADNAAATMRIEKVLRSCALREVWQEGRGEAWLLRSFDAARQKWFLLFLMNDRLS